MDPDRDVEASANPILDLQKQIHDVEDQIVALFKDFKRLPTTPLRLIRLNQQSCRNDDTDHTETEELIEARRKVTREFGRLLETFRRVCKHFAERGELGDLPEILLEHTRKLDTTALPKNMQDAWNRLKDSAERIQERVLAAYDNRGVKREPLWSRDDVHLMVETPHSSSPSRKPYLSRNAWLWGSRMEFPVDEELDEGGSTYSQPYPLTLERYITETKELDRPPQFDRSLKRQLQELLDVLDMDSTPATTVDGVSAQLSTSSGAPSGGPGDFVYSDDNRSERTIFTFVLSKQSKLKVPVSLLLKPRGVEVHASEDFSFRTSPTDEDPSLRTQLQSLGLEGAQGDDEWDLIKRSIQERIRSVLASLPEDSL